MPLVVHSWDGFAIGARVALLWQHNANAKCQRVRACTRFMLGICISLALLISHLQFSPLSAFRLSLNCIKRSVQRRMKSVPLVFAVFLFVRLQNISFLYELSNSYHLVGFPKFNIQKYNRLVNSLIVVVMCILCVLFSVVLF